MSRHNLSLIINFPVYEASRKKKREEIYFVKMNVPKEPPQDYNFFFQTASPDATGTALNKEPS